VRPVIFYEFLIYQIGQGTAGKILDK